MDVQVNFKVINPDYNQQYADEYHFGKESESNWKYQWAVTFEVKDVESVAVLENESFELKDHFEDNRKFNFKIPDVMIYRCYFKDGSYEDFAVSKSILDKAHQAKKEGYDVTRFYFYINSTAPSVQLSPNLVVDEKSVPLELKGLKA